jgi:hypothetical protein
MFLVYNDKFNEILGAHADLKLGLQDTFPFAHEAGVYFPKGDLVYVSSNQFDVHAGREKSVVVSKLIRGLYGDWTRHLIPQQVRMPSGGVHYNDGILDGVLFCSQGDLESPGGLVQIETDYPFRMRTLIDNYHGRRLKTSPCTLTAQSGSQTPYTGTIRAFDRSPSYPTKSTDSIRTLVTSESWLMALADRAVSASRRTRKCAISAIRTLSTETGISTSHELRLYMRTTLKSAGSPSSSLIAASSPWRTSACRMDSSATPLAICTLAAAMA